MKYLVTGAGGFIGASLVRALLEKGYEVRGLDNFYKENCDNLIPLTENPSFEFIRGDITSEADVKKALEGVDGIFHLAAIVGNPACLENPSLSQLVNVDGTKILLNNKKEEQKLIFCSTECIYGGAEKYREDYVPSPSSLYAKQKYKAERDVAVCPNTTSFRFGAAMGLSHVPRLNLLVNTLVYEALINKSLVIFEQDAVRNFISVKDMVRVLIYGMEVNLQRQVYNAGNIVSSKYRVAEIIQRRTGCHIFYGDVNKDPDKRDKPLDCSLLLDSGFNFSCSLEQTIDELIKGLKLVNINHQYC